MLGAARIEHTGVESDETIPVPWSSTGAARGQDGSTVPSEPPCPFRGQEAEPQPGAGGLGVKGILKGARNLSVCLGGSLWTSARWLYGVFHVHVAC